MQAKRTMSRWIVPALLLLVVTLTTGCSINLGCAKVTLFEGRPFQFDNTECLAPVPVIPEAEMPVLMPISAMAVAGGVVAARGRRRPRRG